LQTENNHHNNDHHGEQLQGLQMYKKSGTHTTPGGAAKGAAKSKTVSATHCIKRDLDRLHVIKPGRVW